MPGGSGPTAVPAPADVRGDTRAHDPCLIHAGDAYYVFSTGDEKGIGGGSIQIRRSKDMAEWELVGTVFERTPEWVARELGGWPPNLWAPDIALVNGTFYLYYVGSTFGSNNSVIGLATNTTLDPASPDYKWVDHGMVLRSISSNDWNAIDPSLVSDADGGMWLVFGSYWSGIKLRKIDAATGMLDKADTQLYSLASRGGGAVEAPSIVERKGYYYLFVSFDFCCRGAASNYNIRVGRAEKITGPYVDKEGTQMLGGGGTKILGNYALLRGPGGQTVRHEDSADTYRMIYHTYDIQNFGLPKLQIRDLQWDAQGWPVVPNIPQK
ncbi:hypothetical protein SE17_24870 [Kouleothrix aurantiaca]|uniref:Arabinan endo-1,5-alpha-L-arabinosidase n=1 Tax=Kouleothrix aurantiaca TaxID=186479 RepID=A0A0P9DDH8_9CHLR|nr:hypothetical protein SE17_24870 [Kouleothrix aurantiaca]